MCVHLCDKEEGEWLDQAKTPRKQTFDVFFVVVVFLMKKPLGERRQVDGMKQDQVDHVQGKGVHWCVKKRKLLRPRICLDQRKPNCYYKGNCKDLAGCG